MKKKVVFKNTYLEVGFLLSLYRQPITEHPLEAQDTDYNSSNFFALKKLYFCCAIDTNPDWMQPSNYTLMSTISYRSLIRKFNWKTSLKLQIRSLQITNGALKMHSVVEQKKGIVLFVISSLTSCSVIAIDNYLCSQYSQRPEKKTKAIH